MVGYNIEVSQNFFMLEEAELPDQYSKVSKAIGQGEGMVVVEYRTAIWIGQNSQEHPDEIKKKLIPTQR